MAFDFAASFAKTLADFDGLPLSSQTDFYRAQEAQKVKDTKEDHLADG